MLTHCTFCAHCLPEKLIWIPVKNQNIGSWHPDVLSYSSCRSYSDLDLRNSWPWFHHEISVRQLHPILSHISTSAQSTTTYQYCLFWPLPGCKIRTYRWTLAAPTSDHPTLFDVFPLSYCRTPFPVVCAFRFVFSIRQILFLRWQKAGPC